MNKCPYCNKEIVIKNPDPRRGSLHNHIAKCQKYKEYRDNKTTKEELYRRYKINGESAKQISEELGLSVNYIIKKLKEYNITPRSHKESCNTIKRKERRKETCIKHFGYEHNFCKNSPPRLKMEQKLLNKYMVSNVRQIPWVIDKIQRTTFNNGSNKMAGRISKIEKRVLDYCKDKYEGVILNKPILTEDNRCKYVDIVIGNKGIEIQGNNTHANPYIYKPNDMIVFYTIRGRAIDIWQNEYKRYLNITKQGYELLYIWENEILDNWELVTNNIDKFIKGEIHGNFYYNFNKEN